MADYGYIADADPQILITFLSDIRLYGQLGVQDCHLYVSLVLDRIYLLLVCRPASNLRSFYLSIPAHAFPLPRRLLAWQNHP